jgi:hypothetical protein
MMNGRGSAEKDNRIGWFGGNEMTASYAGFST